jgi:hypothetical protein
MKLFQRVLNWLTGEQEKVHTPGAAKHQTDKSTGRPKPASPLPPEPTVLTNYSDVPIEPPSTAEPPADLPLPRVESSPPIDKLRHELSAVKPAVRPSRARSARTPVVVGFDFGTHSTKVLVRKRNEETARVLTIDEPAQGYPSFASPSVVRIAKERLWFGSSTFASKDGTRYRSLKVRLLGPSAELDGEPFPRGPSPDFLVAAYLAWALGTVRQQLVQKFDNPPVRLNLAAPMDHFENAALKMRYLQIVNAAWELAFSDGGPTVSQGIPLSDVNERLTSLLDGPVPDPSERPFEVLPETVAPIVSMSRNPRMAPGMYMIVDVGAGTTELSVDHVNQRGADQRVLCYFDETLPVGGDRFDRVQAVADGLRRSEHSKLVSKIVKALHRVWQLGYQKDAPNHVARDRWRQLTVLLAGGGSRISGIEDAIRSGSPHLVTMQQYQVAAFVPHAGAIEFPRGQEKAKTDLPLLAVAHGLTRERQTWPIVFEPGQIEVLSPTEAIKQPEPYWYVGGK